jgi:hypothetical protein
MSGLGAPELLFIVLAVVAFRVVPIAIAIWLIVTIVRMRSTLQSLETKVDALLRERRP